MRTLNPSMLVRMAGDRATGALLRETGTVYLLDGEVVHAESPAAPGVDVLLLARRRLSAAEWQEAIDRSGARCRVGRGLVESNLLTSGELEICHLGAVFDAAFFALAPRTGPTRFRYGATHWFGPVRPLPAELVERETRRREELLDQLWPHPEVDSAPVVRRQADGNPAVTPRQRAVLELADGVRTPLAMARLLGRPAFHTLVDVRRLAAAGHVRTPRRSTAAEPSPIPAWVADLSADPDISLLRRLRDALEATL
ncbi:transcriptional regulator [Streptomyces sp. SPB162]|uniref:transcriptional regulator n=1 Tax=Streptomyces sp. SPB162 TaxID=2940560 RepID=UPI002405D76A|nr:transcriptional regulator [Streptomyces sp. SPB162]MDF9810961.1 hypothetical protein [Streptomyces sp. SPB162]